MQAWAINPHPYAPNPYHNPLSLGMKVGLVVVGFAAAGGLVYLGTRVAKAAETKKLIPTKPPREPAEPAQPTEPARVELVQLRAEPAVAVDGTPTVRIATNDPHVSFDEMGHSAYILAQTLPVDLLLSVPQSFAIPTDANISLGPNVDLVAGIPGQTRDLVFRVREYAPRRGDANTFRFQDANVHVDVGRKNGVAVPLGLFVTPS